MNQDEINKSGGNSINWCTVMLFQEHVHILEIFEMVSTIGKNHTNP